MRGIGWINQIYQLGYFVRKRPIQHSLVFLIKGQPLSPHPSVVIELLRHQGFVELRCCHTLTSFLDHALLKFAWDVLNKFKRQLAPEFLGYFLAAAVSLLIVALAGHTYQLVDDFLHLLLVLLPLEGFPCQANLHILYPLLAELLLPLPLFFFVEHYIDFFLFQQLDLLHLLRLLVLFSPLLEVRDLRNLRLGIRHLGVLLNQSLLLVSLLCLCSCILLHHRQVVKPLDLIFPCKLLFGCLICYSLQKRNLVELFVTLLGCSIWVVLYVDSQPHAVLLERLQTLLEPLRLSFSLQF